MANEPEVIRHQMEETRTALTEKLETLEQQVVGTVQGATTAVAETVENVKEAVQQTMDTVKGSVQETVETVKETFNLARQVDQHPWLMLGGSVAVGYLGGCLLRGSSATPTDPDRSGRVSSQGALWSSPQSNGGSRSYLSAPAAEERASSDSSSPSWLGALGETYAAEITQLKGLAIGTLLGLLRDSITRSLPEQMGSEVANIMNRMTEKMGGRPAPEPVFERTAYDRPQEKGASDEGSHPAEMGRPVGAAHGQGQAALGPVDRR